MAKFNEISAWQKVNELAKVIPAQDIFKVVKILGEAYKERQITEREIVKLNNQRDILITEITRKYDLYEKVFEHIFDERQAAVKKSFEIIDKGMAENDRELIGQGLHSLSKIVSSSG
jgi:wyosine [tRNA(Phe)-imidazoG37] synthetase (radical SAM superfamily)